jgi:hypothetical protein
MLDGNGLTPQSKLALFIAKNHPFIDGNKDAKSNDLKLKFLSKGVFLPFSLLSIIF